MNRLIALVRYSAWETIILWNSRKILQVAIFFLFILILGLLIINFPPVQVILILACAIFLIFVAKKPEIGIIAIFIIVASLFNKQIIPFIPIFGLRFFVSDVILLGLFLRIPYKALTDRSFKFQRTPLDVPLLLFLIASVVSVAVSVLKYGQEFGLIVGSGFQLVIYYILFFVITNFIREKKQIRFLFGGLLGIATVVSLVMIIQARVGGSIRLIYGRIESAGQDSLATRILPPGEVVVFIMLISAICVVSMMRKSVFNTIYIYLIPILGGGILLTYNRQYWAAITFSFFIFIIVTSAKTRRRFLSWLAIVFVAVILVVLPLSRLSRTVRIYTDSIVERFSTLLTVRETWSSGSLEWRKIENQYAWRNIIRNPLLGIGLFNIYRPPLPGMDIGEGGWDSKRYVHNGYLFVLMNMGIFGFVPIIWFYVFFLIRGFSKWRKIRDPKDKSILIGLAICGIALSLSALVEPRFLQWRGILCIATISGMSEVIIQSNEKESHDNVSNR